jgi:hypothetical protein
MKLFLLAILAGLPGVILGQTSANQGKAPAANGESRVALIFSGGYETDPQDRGRPVVLIAAALKVPAEVFRKAFSNVRPAPAGQAPEPGQVQKNKQALLESLGPYGVTNDRLDTVSNYYRYNRSRGEMWRTTSAAGYVTVRNGAVTGVTLTAPGSGYSSPPTVSIASQPDVKLTTTLAFGPDFAANGSVKEIKIGSAIRSASP